MKKVKIWEPELKRSQKGREVITEIVKKKGNLLKDCSLMDRTIDVAERGGDDWIIANKKFIEVLEDQPSDEETDEEKAANKEKADQEKAHKEAGAKKEAAAKK